MRVYLMRHAAAEDPGAGADADRHLTEQGRQDAREAGKAIQAFDPGISRVVSSPVLRARETAELVAAALGAGIAVETENRLACGAGTEDFWDLIGAHKDERILLIAHNPELGAFVSGLLEKATGFRPATVCGLEIELSKARLVWMRNPGE